jgi:hypothetical protein
VDALTGLSTPGSRNRWTAGVQIDVVDADDIPVSGMVIKSLVARLSTV